MNAGVRAMLTVSTLVAAMIGPFATPADAQDQR